MDFANKYIGGKVCRVSTLILGSHSEGGVLGHGCVQEEIMFSLNPEALVSLLLCEKMTNSEAIVIYGLRYEESLRLCRRLTPPELFRVGSLMDMISGTYEVCMSSF